MGMNSDMPHLPEEIIRNILKRLPVKSLIRFQCVSKHWKCLIKNNPSFIADHLKHSSHQNPSLLLSHTSRFKRVPRHLDLRLLDSEMQFREIETAPSIDSLKNANIISSCNGLLCVEEGVPLQYRKSPSLLSLWNPATGEARYLPRTRTECSHFDDDCVIGFGFCPITNDYKVVRTFSPTAKCCIRVRLNDAINRVEVFSLKRGSWKDIDIGNLRVILRPETVTANGTIFWPGAKIGATKEGDEDSEDAVGVIVSFDLTKEVFKLFPMPNFKYDEYKRLKFYDNKLAILCDIWDWEHKRFHLVELWVMEEVTCAFGERGHSWTKIYTSSPFPYRLSSLAIWRNEIVSLAGSRNGEEGKDDLFLMNVTNNEVKRFAIPEDDGMFVLHRSHINRIFNYVESLVPVGFNYTEES